MVAWAIHLYSGKRNIWEMGELCTKLKIQVYVTTLSTLLQSTSVLNIWPLRSLWIPSQQYRRKKAAMQEENWSKTQGVPHIPVNKVSSETTRTHLVSFSKQPCINQFHSINIIENNIEFEFPHYIIHAASTFYT